MILGWKLQEQVFCWNRAHKITARFSLVECFLRKPGVEVFQLVVGRFGQVVHQLVRIYLPITIRWVWSLVCKHLSLVRIMPLRLLRMEGLK